MADQLGHRAHSTLRFNAGDRAGRKGGEEGVVAVCVEMLH